MVARRRERLVTSTAALGRPLDVDFGAREVTLPSCRSSSGEEQSECSVEHHQRRWLLRIAA
eukprot:scaffold2838_cov376-Prasinococcus_capsulatus_cf.AAC.2